MAVDEFHTLKLQRYVRKEPSDSEALHHRPARYFRPPAVVFRWHPMCFSPCKQVHGPVDLRDQLP